MMAAHTHQGRERRCHPPKINPPPWTRNPLTKKREYNEEPPPPSDMMSRSKMMMWQTGYWEADC